MAATALLCGLSAAVVLAGEVSNSTDSLNVMGATAGVLPQASSSTGESSLLAGLHISGYASQTFGMWQDPPALRDYTPSRNNLAVSRTLLQVDENYELGDANNFFAREWFVYEPPYSFNSANNGAWSAASPNKSSFGHFMNGYYNNYQVRDAWWENKTGPLTTYIGNQIVVWGQSVAFRVGDVVNPTDTCWAFGFANLEQSRVPQWMLHPILNLPEAGPFSSNFVEALIEPGFSPNYWPEQTNDPYGKYIGEGVKAARVQPCFPAASHGPSARFDVHYDAFARFPLTAQLIGAPASAGSNPLGTEAWRCSQFGPSGPLNFPKVNEAFNPLPPGERNRFRCNLGLSKNNNPYSPIGDHTLLDVGVWNIPGMQPQNWSDGARLHTLLGANELTAFYYNDAVNNGVPWGARWIPQTNLFNYTFYDVQEAGVTMDRPLPIPSSLAEYFPGVFRGEMVYQNHENFPDMGVNNWSGDAYSDVVKWMAAIDVDQAYAPWLTSTGNLSANFEVYDDIIMDNRKSFTIGNALDSTPTKNDVQILASVGTSWLWSDIAPNFAGIYEVKGRNIAMFPSITFNPPWTKKYFMTLQAIEVMGGDQLYGLGLFKGQSLLTAAFQYNFNVM
ncbi:MAG TPA: hypothetical protein VHY56_13410, partial [Candidatus Binataceae bacterium]|nr:hypothetical protein [Candidatus Binataceae bacterium]